MLQRLLITGVLSTFSFVSFAQTTPAPTLALEGQVVNASTGEPVPFATLGVPRRGLGTVADEQGRYLLRLPSLNDTLVVTSVGFSREVIPPQYLVGGQRVFRLEPQQLTLKGVVIEHDRLTPALLGRNTEKGDVLWTGGSSGKETVDDEWGWEFGTLLTPPKRTVLEEFHVFLSANKYEQLRFRLNLYTAEKGRPGKRLLSKDVQLVCAKQQHGWLTVDLRPFEISLEAEPIIATIQWLQSEKTDPWDKYFSIPVKRQSRQVTVERENSEATWTIHAMQPSLYFTVLME
ncbi:carboxypeptidase-like regulatory domain-containing protein [Hymenobacter weizhouensis]|uniref:carboxypeptidase-like regulatory domain-containing protein n=1 Tax=Hymenobacter sp. YIM 151500-1 TaxID=2987689 RepID=UPI0022274ECD|nr:carboxypeptidase-like regulatory domain-containing protein [Hymenobacter sp. YIM 151500-1]UYZ64190.1 carboxypeptidase-like regulatory domain-containing protein [Hymenobacter sp. YIM 151500-1]